MTLIVDTETTGFPPAGRACQLAAALYEGPREVAAFVSVVQVPAGVQMHPAAQEAHGMSLEWVNQVGLPAAAWVQPFIALCMAADCLVAHNLDFDFKVISAWLRDHTQPGFRAFYDLPQFCTMKAMTPIMKLPGKVPGSLKWPKLCEAYKFTTGQDLEGAHDALVDVRACARIYNYLQNANPSQQLPLDLNRA